MACRRGWGPCLLWPLICTPLAVELDLPDPLLPGCFWWWMTPAPLTPGGLGVGDGARWWLWDRGQCCSYEPEPGTQAAQATLPLRLISNDLSKLLHRPVLPFSVL